MDLGLNGLQLPDAVRCGGLDVVDFRCKESAERTGSGAGERLAACARGSAVDGASGAVYIPCRAATLRTIMMRAMGLS
jgi:hypothetical protein